MDADYFAKSWFRKKVRHCKHGKAPKYIRHYQQATNGQKARLKGTQKLRQKEI